MQCSIVDLLELDGLMIIIILLELIFRLIFLSTLSVLNFLCMFLVCIIGLRDFCFDFTVFIIFLSVVWSMVG